MSYDFPESPSINQHFTPGNGPTWRWNGSAWMLLGGGESVETIGTGVILVSAIDEPTPPPTMDGTLWYDPSTGLISVWYGGHWYPEGTPAASSPTAVVGQQITVTVGPVATLIKQLDLPVSYFDTGNAYYAQFPNAHAAGWSSPDFFPIGVFLSPAQVPHAANIAAAGINHYCGIEHNVGNVEDALAAGIGVMPQHNEWTPDQVDVENSGNNPLIVGWNIADEPDMFLDLSYVQTQAALARTYNDGRFTFVNIGHGIFGLPGEPQWSPTTVDDMVREVDVGCVDEYLYSAPGVRIHAYRSPYWPGPGLDPLEARRAAAYGWIADRMRSFQDPENLKPYWVFVETARPLLGSGSPENEPWITLPQISGAAWSAIRHGARGILFFQHNDGAGISFYSVSDAESTVIRNHVTALTTEISSFAAVINGPTYDWDFGDDNVETMLKAYDGDAYIFAGTSVTSPIAVATSDIVQSGDTLQFQFTDTAETGTVSSTITVPDKTELVVVMVSGLHGTASGFASMTFTKGGTDTAMVKATGGDASGATWQSAIFTLTEPDAGASKSLKWDWLGAASDGPRTIAVSFWRGIDLANPIRDSNGVQSSSFALETPILIETPTLEVAAGDRVLGFCGMYNSVADGSATVNVWHHMAKMTENADLTHQTYAEGSLATGTPDGDCTVGIENISDATQAAVVAIVIKQATLEAVTSTIEQVDVATTVYVGGSTANTGSSDTFTVPADTEFVLVGISGHSGVEDGYASVTMPKGGVDTEMVKLPGGDASADFWQGGLFYITSPDIGASKQLKWNFAGTAPAASPFFFSVTFWKGVDLADPVRDYGGTQNQPFVDTFPMRTPMLENREGDMMVAWFAGFTSGEGSIDSWKNLDLLANPELSSFIDGAWGSSSLIGSAVLGAETGTGFTEGALIGVVLKPDATVTPVTPAAEPPTTPRSIITGSFTLPPDLSGAATVEVVGESRTVPVVAGVFEDDFDEEWSYHAYRIPIP